jgi:small-conductance mechanosensitive channel
MRRLMQAGSSFLLLLTLMFLGSLGLWVVMPVFWLWVGGRVQGATQSLGAAVAVVLIGVVVSIGVAIPLLSWLNRKSIEARESRGLPERGRTPLESVMIVSATLALIGFGVWFILFAGAEPVPLGLPK